MRIVPIQTRVVMPPQDDVFDVLLQSKLSVQNGDVVVISSKIVSIHEGRCVLNDGTVSKDNLAKKEASYYVEPPRIGEWKPLFTITQGVLISRAGIDESNANGYFVLYPKDAMKSAANIREWIMKQYGVKKVGVIVSDSRSTPSRRGAVGFALGWAGIEPLRDYRGKKDIFGRAFNVEVANLVDGLASAAVVTMGEGNQQTPVAVISDAPIVFTDTKRPQERFLKVRHDNDLFSSFLLKRKWKKGGKN